MRWKRRIHKERRPRADRSPRLHLPEHSELKCLYLTRLRSRKGREGCLSGGWLFDEVMCNGVCTVVKSGLHLRRHLKTEVVLIWSHLMREEPWLGRVKEEYWTKLRRFYWFLRVLARQCSIDSPTEHIAWSQPHSFISFSFGPVRLAVERPRVGLKHLSVGICKHQWKCS